MANPRDSQPASERLIPISDFEEAVRKVLRAPKREVDRTLADLQAKHKAERKKRGPGK